MVSLHARSGPAQLFSEFVATFGLLSVIWGCSRVAARPRTVRRRGVHHGGVLVHRVHVVCESGGDIRACADRHVRRHSTDGCSRFRRRAIRRRHGRDMCCSAGSFRPCLTRRRRWSCHAPPAHGHEDRPVCVRAQRRAVADGSRPVQQPRRSGEGAWRCRPARTRDPAFIRKWSRS